MTPAARVNQTFPPVKNCPMAVKPSPSRKKAKLMPTTKKKVLIRTFLRG